MKKIAVVSLILALMGPAIGLLCACCPVAEAGADTPSIERSHCDCCETLELNKDSARIQFNESLVPVLIRIGSSLTAALLAFQTIEPSAGINRRAESPPRFSKETPLFLAQGVLRL